MIRSSLSIAVPLVAVLLAGPLRAQVAYGGRNVITVAPRITERATTGFDYYYGTAHRGSEPPVTGPIQPVPPYDRPNLGGLAEVYRLPGYRPHQGLHGLHGGFHRYGPYGPDYYYDPYYGRFSNFGYYPYPYGHGYPGGIYRGPDSLTRIFGKAL